MSGTKHRRGRNAHHFAEKIMGARKRKKWRERLRKIRATRSELIKKTEERVKGGGRWDGKRGLCCAKRFDANY